MNYPLTQYGSEDLSNTLSALSSIIEKRVSKSDSNTPRKQLRKFKMREASDLVGRSDAYLRKSETDGPEFMPEKINNVRYYSLDLINKLRDKAGTRYTRPTNSEACIIAVTNYKGGVGKTITSKTIADKCALMGMKVLSIGLDPQGTDSLYHGLVPDLDIKQEETICDLLTKDPSKIKNVIQKSYFPGIDIIPGNSYLNNAELDLTDHAKQVSLSKQLGFPDERLKRALEYIKNDYDIILLDCGPNLMTLSLNAIEACDGMLVPLPPAMPDEASFGSYANTLSNYLQNTEKTKRLNFFRIVVTKYQNNATAREVVNNMREDFGSLITLRNIVYSSEIEKASSDFCSIYEIQPNSRKPYLRAMESVESVTNEIVDAMKMIWDAQAQDKQEIPNRGQRDG